MNEHLIVRVISKLLVDAVEHLQSEDCGNEKQQVDEEGEHCEICQQGPQFIL